MIPDRFMPASAIPIDFIILADYGDVLEPLLAREKLMDAGIDAMIVSPNVGMVTGDMDGPLPEIAIYVHRKDLMVARDIIAAMVKTNNIDKIRCDSKIGDRSLLFTRMLLLIAAAAFCLFLLVPYNAHLSYVRYLAIGCAVFMLAIFIATFLRAK
jgi:hypothetical protein